jgi:phenylacetate-CoA ligase
VALSSAPGEGFAAVGADEFEPFLEISRATLAEVGIESGGRVLLSLNNDGDLGSAWLAQAIGRLGATATSVSPRGRMRLLAVLRALRPRVWMTTPQGALDLLARLYLEFNVDPMELELERIVLVGEIASAGAHRRLADEFEADVADLYCDPFFGAALACRREGRVIVPEESGLALAAIGKDEIIPRLLGDSCEDFAEIVLRPRWSGTLSGSTLRTGQVVGGTGEGLFQHTVGDHVLVRGRWISLPLLRRALARIDGTVAWRLEVSRGDGTLDHLRVVLGFDRPTLVENPMWLGRAREAIAGVIPISFEIEAELAEEVDGASSQVAIGQVVDHRGHHLATERAGLDPSRSTPTTGTSSVT